MTSIAKPRSTTRAAEERARAHAARLRRRDVDAVRRLRTRLGDRGASSRPSGSSTSPPHRAAKMTRHRLLVEDAAYFMKQSHGFNCVHGRMPSLATGANAANRDLTYIGISGDGDSLSIGLGQLCHADPPQREHALRAREQRRVRTDQGPVLGVGRRGIDVQEGRSQPFSADRPGAARADARRDVRGAQLLRRQGAARADPQGGLRTRASPSSTSSRRA